MAEKAYLAIDMGASSGRHLIGRFDGQRLQLDEVYRFENGPVDLGGRQYWDLPGLWSRVRQGLSAAGAAAGGDAITSVGVDTWGVDFGLLGRNDELLGNPYHYRDSRTNGMLERAFLIVPREDIFRHTGLQFMQFNTLYQLLAMKLGKSPLLDVAETILFMPDLMHWLLTGVKCNEMTEASTSQFYNPVKCGWATELLQAFGLPTNLLGRIVQPGTKIGPLRGGAAAETGLRAQVVLPGSHDTASAVMAVPSSSKPGERPDWCYISLGTWALMGIESPAPVINDKVLERNFTNEGGVGNTIRLLKNITGLWLVQECRRVEPRGAGLELGGPQSARGGRPAAGFFHQSRCRRFPLAGEHAPGDRRFLHDDQPARSARRRGRAALRAGQHRHEVPARAGDVRGVGGRADRNDPHRRWRDAKPLALPGRCRRLRPPRRGRPGRGHGDRQHHDASRGRRRGRLDCRGPRGRAPQFQRRRVRTAEHGRLGRRLPAVFEGLRVEVKRMVNRFWFPVNSKPKPVNQ